MRNMNSIQRHQAMPVDTKLARATKLMAEVEELIASDKFTKPVVADLLISRKLLADKINVYKRKASKRHVTLIA